MIIRVTFKEIHKLLQPQSGSEQSQLLQRVRDNHIGIGTRGMNYTMKMKKIDDRLKVCFMTATYQNYEALKGAFPTIEIECYIQKPVEIKDLVRRINAELEQ